MKIVKIKNLFQKNLLFQHSLKVGVKLFYNDAL